MRFRIDATRINNSANCTQLVGGRSISGVHFEIQRLWWGNKYEPHKKEKGYAVVFELCGTLFFKTFNHCGDASTFLDKLAMQGLPTPYELVTYLVKSVKWWFASFGDNPKNAITMRVYHVGFHWKNNFSLNLTNDDNNYALAYTDRPPEYFGKDVAAFEEAWYKAFRRFFSAAYPSPTDSSKVSNVPTKALESSPKAPIATEPSDPSAVTTKQMQKPEPQSSSNKSASPAEPLKPVVQETLQQPATQNPVNQSAATTPAPSAPSTPAPNLPSQPSDQDRKTWKESAKQLVNDHPYASAAVAVLVGSAAVYGAYRAYQYFTQPPASNGGSGPAAPVLVNQEDAESTISKSSTGSKQLNRDLSDPSSDEEPKELAPVVEEVAPPAEELIRAEPAEPSEDSQDRTSNASSWENISSDPDWEHVSGGEESVAQSAETDIQAQVNVTQRPVEQAPAPASEHANRREQKNKVAQKARVISDEDAQPPRVPLEHTLGMHIWAAEKAGPNRKAQLKAQHQGAPTYGKH